MRQATRNLIGNARDLWVTGIRDIRAQRANLDVIAASLGVSSSAAMAVIDECRAGH